MFGLTPDQQAFLFQAIGACILLSYVTTTAWLLRNRHWLRNPVYKLSL
jgi:K+ transporter